MKKLLAPLALLIIWSCSGPASQVEAQNKAQTKADQASALVQNLLEKYKTPGVAVSVSKDGNMIWTKGFGYSDAEKMELVSPSETMFRIGSVSKTLTAAALGKLYEEGKLDFDEIIQTYVADFPEKEWPITVRQVAGHTAGIRHYRGSEFMSSKFYATVDEGLAIFEDDDLLFKPDSDYSYSSYGWNLISAVVENISEEPFLDYMSAIFNTMGMSHTMADVASEEIKGRTSFYAMSDGEAVEAPYVDNSYKWAGGGFIGTSEDLIQFGNVYLENSFTSAQTWKALTDSHQLDDGSPTNYGIGWRSGTTDKGVRWVGHSGGSVGGITMFAVYPEQNIVVALCSNSSDHNWDGLHHQLAVLFSE